MFEKEDTVRYFGITAGLNLVLTIVYQTWEEASKNWLPVLWILSVLSVLLALLFYPIPEEKFEEYVTNGVAISLPLNVGVVVGLLVSGAVGFQISAGFYAVGIVVFYLREVINSNRKDEYTEVVNPMNNRQLRFAY
jgi:hypothetical protein